MLTVFTVTKISNLFKFVVEPNLCNHNLDKKEKVDQ